MAIAETTANARFRRGPSGNVVVTSDSEVGATSEQPALAVRESAEQRGEREHDNPGNEDSSPAENVAGPAAQQQETAEGERVGVDDPLQARAGEAERVLNVRQGDVHDGGVEHHHQLGRGDDHKGKAEAALGRARGRGGTAGDGRPAA
jgi:hypothetical protein